MEEYWKSDQIARKYEGFTEKSYRELIKNAKRQFCFSNFSQYKDLKKKVLWRHDVDFSVHRAYALAKIEAEEEVKSTFFFNLHSCYYNVLEADCLSIVKEIIKMGHNIGLHFDMDFMQSQDENITIYELMDTEKKILEYYFRCEITAVSFHNPIIDSIPDSETIVGMVNCYCRFLREQFRYCSDSNGYWRFERLQDILDNPDCQSLQVLIHPEWWTSEPMSPRNRIRRCIDGRAAKVLSEYDRALSVMGRENVY